MYLLSQFKRYLFRPRVKVNMLEMDLFSIVILVLGIVIGVTLAASGKIKLFAAQPTYTWTQTDWVGGVSGTPINANSNTYLSATNINTGIAGSITLSERAGWYNTAWSYRKQITFNNTTAALGVTSAAHTDFPVLVVLNNTNFDFTKVKNDGGDIRFTDSDGTTQLSYQIESWNYAGQLAYIWVKVPQIDINSAADSIYIYYGNAAATSAQNAAQVWSSGYVGVYLMNEALTNTTVTDSSPSNNTGTAQAGMTAADQINGQIDGSFNFDGTATDFINLGQPASLQFTPNTQNFTIEAWINMAVNQANTIISRGNNTAAQIQYEMYVTGNNLAGRVGGVNVTTTTAVTGGTWRHVALKNFDNAGKRFRLYADGLAVGTQGTSGTGVSDRDVLIGARRNTTNANVTSSLSGDISMVLISNVARSDAWLAASNRNGLNTFATYGTEVNKYENTGTLTSNVFDTQAQADWKTITYTTTGTGSVTIKARSANVADMSDATDWAACTAITSGTLLSNNACVQNLDRYLQYQIVLAPLAGQASTVTDIAMDYSPSDLTAPPTNASNLQITGVTNGNWANFKPTLTWTAGVDDGQGIGILGYCIAIDEANIGASASLNPAITSGKLTGLDDGIVPTYCPFIATGTSIDLNAIAGLNLVTGKQYYVSIKAVDASGNIWNGAGNQFQDLVSFRFDNTPPTPPVYVSLPGNFVSTKNITFTWPAAGGDSATDAHSGLVGIQYRIGPNGTWYGDVHNGSESITDLMINDGAYTMDPTYDHPNLIEGSNLLYIRAIDVAGNISTTFTNGTIKLNTLAPSQVQGLNVTPATNTLNSYAFTWNVPQAFTGLASNITYCYTINALPSVNNCTFTAPGITSLPADAYATQPGTNTIYVVARDEASNINYDTYQTAQFTYNGSAPGIPLNLDIADISVKATSNWRLAISWDQPADTGAGVSAYRVYRSTTVNTCSGALTGFTQIGTSGSLSYVDSGLTQQTYHYCVRACDSANNCSASSNTVDAFPTGRFITPPVLISEPVVRDITTRKATISWVTDRSAEPKIMYGTQSGVYLPEEISSSAISTNHELNLNNLLPGTTYYFKAKWVDEDGNIGLSDEYLFTTLPAPEIINITATQIRTNSALISFRIKDATEATLLYGPTRGYGGSIKIPTSPLESTYSLQLDTLADGTTYNYKLVLDDRDGFEYDTLQNNTFNTLPRPKVLSFQVEEIKNSAQPTVKIVWQTNTAASAFVTYHPDDNPSLVSNEVSLDPKTDHEMTITNLLPNSTYSFVIKAVDSFGNQGVSNEFKFTTATDSRPPTISNIRVSKSNVGSGDNQKSQMIVSWETDEPATSQVEYGEGSTASYNRSTVIDSTLKVKHIVVLNDLRPSSVYSIRAVVADSAGNTIKSRNLVSITRQNGEDPVQLVLGRLTDIFGFLDTN